MIESRQNTKIKNLFKLLMKKHRDQTNTFLVFGDHLIEEALKTNLVVEIYTSNASKEGTLISEKIMKELSPVESFHDIVAVVNKPTVKPYTNKILIADDIQDPGNLGALIRTASAFGFNTVLRSFSSADFFNDKTVRATQGNLFYNNLLSGDLVEEIKGLKEKGYLIIAATVFNNYNIRAFKNNKKIALILGNEGAGIKDEILMLADQKITIPTTQVESLNVVVAGSIIMYELSGKND